MNEVLNKKLAEWAGFEYMPHMNAWNLRQKDGLLDLHEDMPNFTESLDACFKQLVPEALKILAKKGYVPPIIKLFQLWYDELVSLTGDSSNVKQAALALCLAIEKLIDEEKGIIIPLAELKEVKR